MKVTARINDEETEIALERGIETVGSRSEAIRKAIVTAYADATESELGETQIRALRALRRCTGEGGRIELKEATAVIANELNIPKATIRSSVFEPLRSADKLEIRPRISSVVVQLTEEEE